MWLTTSLCRYMWLTISGCRYMWLTTSVCRYMWLTISGCRYMWLSTSVCRYMWLTTSVCRFMWLTTSGCASSLLRIVRSYKIKNNFDFISRLTAINYLMEIMFSIWRQYSLFQKIFLHLQDLNFFLLLLEFFTWNVSS